MRTREEVLPICFLVSEEPPSQFAVTYQEDNRDVQQEGYAGVRKQGEVADLGDVIHSQARSLGEQEDDAVHESAGRGVVVKRDQGIHLELARAEQTLDHDETDGLEDDATNLVEEAGHVELDLAERSDHDTENDEGNIVERLHVRWGNSEAPSGEKDGNRGCGLLQLSV